MVDPFVATVITVFVPMAIGSGTFFLASTLLEGQGFGSEEAQNYGVGLGLILGALLFGGLAFGFSRAHEAGKLVPADAAPSGAQGEGVRDA